MHRTIEITLPPTQTEGLVRDLNALDDVIGLTVHHRASRKPPGDVVIVHALNRGADAVLRRVAAMDSDEQVSVVTAEVASIIDPAHREAVEDDVDEAIWEEMETGLRHQGRVTPNYVALMALGGVIAAVGLVSDTGPQAVAFVAASVIAPGFEPLVKIPLGLLLRRWAVLKRGLVSVAVGYVTLIAAAALTFLLLRAVGEITVAEFVANHEVERIAHPTLTDTHVSVCGAAAGMIMVAAYRRSVIAGPLIALIMIPAAAMSGMALVAGRPDLMGAATLRLGIDFLLVTVVGGGIILIKQGTVHRRDPLV